MTGQLDIVPNRNELLEQFMTDVHYNGRELDPNNELDWYSLTVGFAIGKGYSVKRALSFARWARYEKQVG